ncbi:MAG: chorismate mutase [bacterium]
MKLEKLRGQIDKIDKKLLKILAERFVLTRKVGEYKKEASLPARDKVREKQVFAQRKKWAEELDIDRSLVEKLFQLIIKKVCREHKWKNL